MRHTLGTFTVTSDSVRITDPSYTIGIWCAGQTPAVPGTWTAHVVIHQNPRDGKRVHRLLAHHESFVLNPDENSVIRDRVKLDWEAGVDRGMCGIFDAETYRTQGNGHGTHRDLTTFYGQACELTNGPHGGGVFPWGCVSESGYGDGSYRIFVVNDANSRAVYVEIVFIGDEAEEEM
ncbi:MAG: hypothetical protein AAB384_04100 [Patescibacteria group bacterium]